MRTLVIPVDPEKPEISCIRLASNIIRSGGTVAFPTETVYGIGANALSSKAVKKIFKAKGRPADNPLIVHIDDIADLQKITIDIPLAAHKIIKKFWPGPITLVLKKSSRVPEITTGGLNSVAVRMPKNNIALSLINESDFPIAAPSANISGRPSPTSITHVLTDLNSRINMILDGGDTKIGIESTVLDMTQSMPMLLRPGAVTIEQIQKTIGRIRIHSSLLGKNYSRKLTYRSPGMKYNHYSPNASVILIEGPKVKRRNKIIELASEFMNNNKKVCVMTNGTQLQCNAYLLGYMGSNFSIIAKNLFKIFRYADDHQVDIIIVEGIKYEKLGWAIMNRLNKAATTIIKV